MTGLQAKHSSTAMSVSSSRSGALKSAFDISVVEEEESDDVSINQLIHNYGQLAEDEVEQESSKNQENEEDKSVYDIPETQGLLPPLPNEPQSAKSTTSSQPVDNIITSPTDNSSTSPSQPRRSSQSRQSLLTTPTQEYSSQFETPLSSEITSKLSSNSNSSNWTTGFQTPKRKEDDLESEVLTYSPAITIDERFEVSLDIPITEANTPKTIEEKIKFYEKVQKKELDEFNKTLKSLEKSGWMSERELIQLETSKTENFNKWETKIKSLKRSLRSKKPSLQSINSSINPISPSSISSINMTSSQPQSSTLSHSGIIEDYFQPSHRSHSKNGSHGTNNVITSAQHSPDQQLQPSSTNHKKLFGDSLRSSSTLHSLEQKFSSFGLSR